MPKEIKKISVNAFERIVNESNEPQTIKLDWHGEELFVTHRLSLENMMVFVNGVVNTCFTEDGSYVPEVREFTTRCAVLELYGNFRLPQNVSKRYELVLSSAGYEAFEMIVNNIDFGQFEMITDAISDGIDYRINTDIEKANRRVNELAASLEQIGEQLNGLFGDMSADEAKALIASLVNGVDEEKLMNAYLDKNEHENAATQEQPTLEVIQGGGE